MIGGGIVGYNAAVMVLGLGAQVTILERSIERMRHLEEVLSGRVTLLSSALQIQACVEHADLVIDAVLIPGAVAPKLVTREMVGGMRTGSIVCDVAIDQGGCMETSRPTRHTDPVYAVDGVTHYCVANMPGAVPVNVHRGAHERDAAVRRGDRRSWAWRGRRARPRPGPRRQRAERTHHTPGVAEAHGLNYAPHALTG